MPTVSETRIAPTPTPSQTIALDVTGMKCAGCVKAVERQLAGQPGVRSVRVNFATEVAALEYDPDRANPDELAAKLTSAGFPTQIRQGDDLQDAYRAQDERQRQEIRAGVVRVCLAGVPILLSGLGHLGILDALSNMWFHWALATAAIAFPAREIAIDGWQSLRRNRPNMNSLVTLGAVSAYGASCIALWFPSLGWECFFDEPVMLLGFILLGRTLESLARRRAARSMRSLVALQPRTARLVFPEENDDRLEIGQTAIDIPAARVRVGEYLQVLPGETIPADGEIAIGQTTADESMLTGESVPVLKQVGDPVTGGTTNQSGAILVRVTRTGAETTLARIVAAVEDAQTRKAPVQHLADTVAGYFTYGVISVALLTFLFWSVAGTQIWPHVLDPSAVASYPLAMGGDLVHAMAHSTSPLLLSLKLAIAVLVIACPCSLGLATPTAILVGTGVGAERGLLLRGGDILERVANVDTVIFDKTGTLTTGRPQVTDCLSARPEYDDRALLQLGATVESGTTHPLAQAIACAAREQGLSLLPAADFHTEAGSGVRATILLGRRFANDGVTVYLGTGEWLERHGVEIPEEWRDRAAKLANEGKTVVAIARVREATPTADRDFLGLIAARDRLRDEARSTVDRCRALGLQVMLLTGDRPETARAIAAELAIAPESIFAGVRPGEKAEAIARVQGNGRRVAMVGDGINDAPALARADVGIALHSGTEVAVETAGIVLVRDDLGDVIESIQLSRATFAKIRQNLVWAFGYNAIGIPIAAGVLLPSFGILLGPSAAAALMAFSSVSVVTNSLLLRYWRSRSDANGGSRSKSIQGVETVGAS
ncbi:heavy metal translocating P-type ATPase [Oxynema aestuarii]|uniref:Copper-translocating P-type ATPase n=1 Tax=Oxynema aestuarii AP17 TaxID=2064643 RepID=A0A6H1TYV1_9CYAN|nr:heavy metal translocating P-type ATPase [Oxynema aestuarii]QIZ71386.1 copper-translocating P-type ATPase [Oxynema aestuarii AP17]